ncbi:hypothetical protein FRC10_004194 [Ceratobasidium sp. 414]|nr:hypothetical protein FRC10_004194 [Ceratobasidium sp. 414]
MPPKRSNPSGSSSERPAKKVAKGAGKATAGKGKAATGGNKASAPRLKKSTQPNWDEFEEYSQDKPTGKWGAKCVERWWWPPASLRYLDQRSSVEDLLSASVSIFSWASSLTSSRSERSALDKINTSGSDESRPIVADALGEDNLLTLRGMSSDIAAAIFGSALDDEHKKRIGRTLLGSLYFTELSGTGEGDGSPREVRAMSRLYSPFGLGISIDLFYSYYVRRRITMVGEQFASLYVNANTIASCDAKKPRRCRTMEPNAQGEDKVAADAITVFDRSHYSGAKDGCMFCWIYYLGISYLLDLSVGSPLKLANILFAAAGVMYFMEDDKETPKSTLAKFQFFQGENDGKGVSKQELAELAKLEKEMGGDGYEYEYGVCVPQRLLLLARQDFEESEGESI